MALEFINQRKMAIIIAAHYLIALLIKYDSIFFQYNSDLIDRKNMIIMKILFLPYLWLVYSGGVYVFKSRKTEPRFFNSFLLIFIIYCWVWLIVRPGTYFSMPLYEQASLYRLDAWQNIYTSVWTILCLELCPSIQWSLLLQSGIAAFCYAYLTNAMMQYIGINYGEDKKNDILTIMIFIIPFISLPLVFHLFSNFRMAIYPAFECLLVAVILKIDKGTKYLVYALPLLVGIVAVMRTEGVYWIIFIILFIIMWCKKGAISLSKSFLLIIICISVVLLMNCWQNKELNNQYDNDGVRDYALTSIMCPGVELIRNATEDDYELLNDIAKIVNIKMIRDNPDRDGGSMTYEGGLIKSSSEYSEREYERFKSSLIRLGLRHPNIVFSERMKWIKYYLTIDGVDDYYGETIGGINSIDNQSIGTNWSTSKQVKISNTRKNLRSRLIYFLTSMDNDATHKELRHITHNMLLPAFLCLIVFIISVKKSYMMTLLSASVLVRTAIVILTTPGNSTMYLIPTYVLGWFFFIIMISQKIKKVGENEEVY